MLSPKCGLFALVSSTASSIISFWTVEPGMKIHHSINAEGEDNQD